MRTEFEIIVSSAAQYAQVIRIVYINYMMVFTIRKARHDQKKSQMCFLSKGFLA